MRRLGSPVLLFFPLVALALAGCSDGYSPNTYAANAAQVEAAVQRGTIIGVRQITISPDGTVGAAAGGAVGGVAGAQVAGAPVVTALGAIGGTLVGGIGGAAAAQAVGKTKGWEYIVQEEPGDKLVSVTQTSKASLPLGLHVLVIAGTQQARIVPDYTVQIAAAPPPPKPVATADGAPPDVRIDPLLPAVAADPLQGAPIAPPPPPVAAEAATPAATPTATPDEKAAPEAANNATNSGGPAASVQVATTTNAMRAAPAPSAAAGVAKTP